jgi:dipeptidyl aminopeptidase/acylaminoacyl peptidase
MKKTLTLALFLFWLAAPLLAAADSQPLTFDDFIKVKRLSDVQLSPRGDLLAFVVTEIDKTQNRGNSDIWVAAVDGTGLRRLTSSPQADFSPRWSPDGKTIAFISTRGGSAQVWAIDLGGGEARAVTNFGPGTSGVIWSPTGKQLAFTASVFPDCPDEDCNKKKSAELEQSKVQARLYHELLIRHWNAWSDGRRSHLFIMDAPGGKPLDLTPGDYDTPPIALEGDQDYDISPDGAEVCFVRNIDPEFRKALGTNNDLFLVPARGGEVTRLTTNKANDISPLYSPDGRFLAYKAMARPGFEADKFTLMVYDRKARSVRNLTAGLDFSVGEFVWTADGSDLYFSAEEGGRMSVFRISSQGGPAAKILQGHTLRGLALSPDGKTLYFLKQSVELPAEVFSYQIAATALAQVTRFNAGLLAGLALSPVEEFSFKGGAGDTVHGFLLKPPSFDPSKKYPLVMLLHGGPQGAWLDEFHYRWNAPMFAAPGYAVAMINFHGSTGYGQAFTDSISGDWGGKPYQDIMLGLDWLLAHNGWIDKDRLAAAGASYGGYLIDWIEGQSARFRCLVSHSGVYDIRSMFGATEELWFAEWEFKGTPWTSKAQYDKWSPSSYVTNFKTPCLVVHGQNDFRVPLSQGLQFYTALQLMNVPSKFLTFPDEDHFVQKPQNAELWWKTVLGWLADYLKK